jgi:hypothetical protein
MAAWMRMNRMRKAAGKEKAVIHHSDRFLPLHLHRHSWLLCGALRKLLSPSLFPLIAKGTRKGEGKEKQQQERRRPSFIVPIDFSPYISIAIAGCCVARCESVFLPPCSLCNQEAESEGSQRCRRRTCFSPLLSDRHGFLFTIAFLVRKKGKALLH